MRASTVALLLLAAGCKSSHGGAADAGPPDAAGLPNPTASAACTPDFVGLRTICDGSASSDPAGRSLVYAWSLASVPSGSKLTASGADPSFSFVGDRGGGYSVQLTVTTPDGASGSTTVAVLVPTLPLFYRAATLGKSSDSFALAVVQSDGSGARTVSCAVTVADASGTGDAGAANRGTYGDTPGLVGTRVRYAAGGPATVVFEEVTPAEHRLLVSDENGDCASHPPVRIDATPAAQHLVPRFSPDGTRVAWIDVGTPSSLITAAVDQSGGTARRIVRTSGKLKTTPPQWLDATHVAWVEDASANSTPQLQIVSAVDAAGAGDSAATVLVDCNGAMDMQVINQFELVGTIYYLSGGPRSRLANPPGATVLYRLAGTSCSSTAATALATEPAGGFAWDFTFSPDANTIAMAAMETGGGPHDLFLVPADGSVQPSRFVGSAPGADDIGPQWIAGGKQLTWTQIANDGSASGGGIMIANRDGSGVRSLVAEGGSTSALVFVGGPTNRGLDCSAAGGGAAVADALLLVCALWLARRRRA